MLHHSGVPRDILSSTYRDQWIGRGGPSCVPALTLLELSGVLDVDALRERFICLTVINDAEIIQQRTVPLSAQTLTFLDVFDS